MDRFLAFSLAVILSLAITPSIAARDLPIEIYELFEKNSHQDNNIYVREVPYEDQDDREEQSLRDLEVLNLWLNPNDGQRTDLYKVRKNKKVVLSEKQKSRQLLQQLKSILNNLNDQNVDDVNEQLREDDGEELQYDDSNKRQPFSSSEERAIIYKLLNKQPDEEQEIDPMQMLRNGNAMGGSISRFFKPDDVPYVSATSPPRYSKHIFDDLRDKDYH